MKCKAKRDTHALKRGKGISEEEEEEEGNDAVVIATMPRLHD